ncbi:transposase [Streptomyces sp. NPDC057148]|uniref:transposase n=1 Tax=unclassified Streptomyces TaxID=2593676 RepID=UPI003635E31F
MTATGPGSQSGFEESATARAQPGPAWYISLGHGMAEHPVAGQLARDQALGDHPVDHPLREWPGLLTQLQSLADAKGEIVWDLSVDSTVCRAHQHAAGARNQGDLQKEPAGGNFSEPRDHGLGRSRGGFTTKLHLTVEQGQKPMSIVVTAGQRGDSPQFEPVLDKIRVPRLGPGRPRTRPNRVRADKAYASRKNRAYLRRRGIRCTIPDKADRPVPQPQEARPLRRPATEVRPGRLP